MMGYEVPAGYEITKEEYRERVYLERRKQAAGG